MKFRTSAAAVLAAAAALAVGAAPANAATAAKTNPALSISASTRWAHYGDTVTLTAHLGKTAANRTVTIYRSPAGESTQVVKTGKVDRYGNLRASVWLGRNTTFTVKFAGDKRDNAASRSVYVHDAVSERQDMWHGQHRADGWWYVNGSGGLYSEAWFSPNKSGETAYFHVQEYYQGAWRDVPLNVPNAQLDGNSYAAHGWQTAPKGLTLRFATTFNGDSLNDGSGYHWMYVKTV